VSDKNGDMLYKLIDRTHIGIICLMIL